MSNSDAAKKVSPSDHDPSEGGQAQESQAARPDQPRAEAGAKPHQRPRPVDPGEGKPAQDQPARKPKAGQGQAKAKGQGKAAGTGPSGQKPQAQPAQAIKPVAEAAQVRSRHWGLAISFVALVILPSLVVAGYLWTRAVDQYASYVGFTVRSEEITSPMELLGGLTGASGAASSDTDILYEYIQSQELVRQVDAELDLRELYAEAWPEDPYFALPPDGSIETLLEHWQRMVQISYDAGTGLIELRVLAFGPEDAQAIAQSIFDNSSDMINELSAIARDDATRYAQQDLEQAVERLKQAREALTAFRSRTQIVDPAADLEGQMGLLAMLQEQLATALIELDLLRDSAQAGDPRITQAERRIEVIRNRIAEERQKFSADGQGPGGENYADLVADYESLAVDRQFAEEAYTAAMAAYDTARAEAQRRSRYLAAFVRPTEAEISEYPRRGMLLGMVVGFAFLGWAILCLIYYSIRDRR